MCRLQAAWLSKQPTVGRFYQQQLDAPAQWQVERTSGGFVGGLAVVVDTAVVTRNSGDVAEEVHGQPYLYDTLA